MNYELAKELKDAGFLQHTHDCAMYLDEEGVSEVRRGKTSVQDAAYIPTLSELIEACGEDFGFLEKFNDEQNWSAGDSRKLMDFGKTPAEAVARLWLALNKKT